ncbi:MAG: sialate O-acetylesterase [Ruminococcaceae bacterium]|nr:sialate O-acetylesterase [Oscillospiraceae bacterium]
MKRIIAVMLILVSVALTSCGDSSRTVNTDSTPSGDTESIDNGDGGNTDTNEKSIDIYIIAGQSNAVGHSKINDMETIASGVPGVVKGYSNIYYAGNARTDTVVSSVRYIIDNDVDWQNVTVGLGRQGGYIGPELGMAEVLSSYYNKNTGKEAGIIKFAHGGTSLFDKSTGSNQFGNWVSPSYAEELGLGYEDGDVTGQLYRDLLLEVSSNILALKKKGYTDIKIKGLYWMQGENDRGEPNNYERVFPTWVKDIRGDLSDMMRFINESNDDSGASSMPVFVGTISKTFALSAGDKTGDAINQPFIDMQKRLTGIIENCYVIDNSKYAINVWEFENDKCVVVGADTYHWNQNDMISIGKDIGNAILRNCLSSWNDQDDELWNTITQTDPNGAGWTDTK